MELPGPWTLVVPRVPISQNDDEWKERWKRLRYKAAWEWDVWALCKEQRIPPLERVRLSAVVYFPDRLRRDLDNYHAPVFKAAQDALEAACVIPRDDTRYIPELPGLTFGYDRERPRTELTITALPRLVA